MAEKPTKKLVRKPAPSTGSKPNDQRAKVSERGKQAGQQVRSAAASGIRSAKTAAAKRQAKPEMPKDVPMVYGAEAIAAITVSEAKLSRFKGRAILALLLICVSLVFWNAALHASKPEPKLLGVTQDGRFQELPLLDEPLESRQVLIDWVRRNIPDLYDWNYANYRKELNEARDYTQQVTLEKFKTDLETSGVLPKVLNDFLILRANIVDEPVVVNETEVKGRRLYVVEIPLRLIYDSGEVENGQRRRINQDILFTAWVVRANVLEYDAGLMLAKYAIQQRR